METAIKWIFAVVLATELIIRIEIESKTKTEMLDTLMQPERPKG